ncbi:MAG: LrgB family protein, partial [Oscillospiraceae bacterium]|nr:LrgB family protein [Oscillospiraceae bacterium]
MKELFASASYAGAALTMIAFFTGSLIKDIFKSQLFNPILIAMIIIISFLTVTGIDYDTYNSGAKYISWFLTPATVSLAIPLYRQIEQLKNNVFAILAGIFS